LRRKVVRDGEPVWIASENLAASSQVSAKSLDLVPLLGGAGKEPSQPKLTGSLKIILADFVNRARNEHLARGENADNITEDLVLLMLAGSGKACWLMDPTGEPVWLASIEGVQEFNEASAGKKAFSIRMDETLTGVAQFGCDLGQAKVGSDLPMDAIKLALLQSLEIAGEAVAYKDFDGALAWKASEGMQEDFR
jgi:hypothetical protein